MARTVDTVLTAAYYDIYGKDESNMGQLNLVTSPVNSSEEVLKLYTGGLIPEEAAVPCVMTSIGASKDSIDAAVKWAVARRDSHKGGAPYNAQLHADTPSDLAHINQAEEHSPSATE